jgi:hypothetical protein
MKYDTFSLTPALSRWERENCIQFHGKPSNGICGRALNGSKRGSGCSLSQRERVRVRENATTTHQLPIHLDTTP